MGDDATVVLTDIDLNSALSSSDKEAKEKPAALVVVGGELNGTLFDIVDPETSVGRSPNNSIPLEFQGISRVHFKILMTEADLVLEDCGSKNGTFLNNVKLEEKTPLVKGDVIKIGKVALKYIPKGDSERLTYDKLYLDSITDTLTGCYNKGYVNAAAELAVKKSKITGNPLSLIFFDLDKFKSVNDTYGHDAGDYVLTEMADIIRKNGVRDGDTFGRYGGEEFVILLPKTNLKFAFEIAERLRKLIESHRFIYNNSELPVTASIGVADYREGVLVGADLFIRADEAMYKAKEGGRNQVQYYRA